MGLVSTLGWQPFKGPKTIGVDGGDQEEDTEDVKRDTEGRQSNVVSRQANISQYRKENIKDGDYVYAPDGVMEGVYYRGGIIIDFKNEDSLAKEFNEEWRDDTIATSSVIKLRKISGTTFFSKGIL